MSPGAALAALSAAAAVLLILPPRPRSRLPAPAARPDPGASARSVVVPLLGLAAGSLTVLDARLLGLGVAAAVATVGAVGLLRRRARRRTVAARRHRIAETCELLAAELAAGQPPGLALRRAAQEWPDLAPVAMAGALGADVPAAWRELAERPGAETLRFVAAGWQVAHASGAGLAGAMERVAAMARSAESTRRVIASELASARATARLMAMLPILALAMGSGVGGNPWAFLFLTTPGIGCLIGAISLGAAGLWWIESIADGVAGESR